MVGGATNNVVGGETPGVRNLISGNGDSGVWLEGGFDHGKSGAGQHHRRWCSGRRAPWVMPGTACSSASAPADNVVGGDTPGAAQPDQRQRRGWRLDWRSGHHRTIASRAISSAQT